MPLKNGKPPPRHKEPGWRYWSARHARSPAPENHFVTFFEKAKKLKKQTKTVGRNLATSQQAFDLTIQLVLSIVVALDFVFLQYDVAIESFPVLRVSNSHCR